MRMKTLSLDHTEQVTDHGDLTIMLLRDNDAAFT